MPQRKPLLRLTPYEADAILSLLSFAWADFEAMTDSDVKEYGFDSRWLDAARRGHSKIRAMRGPQNPRGKPMANGPDVRRAHMDGAQ